MEEQKTQRCSCCKCTLLERYFSLNRKGELYKTCDKCREKIRKRPRVKKHQCPTCKYKCVLGTDLKKHIKAIHEKIKDHKCPHCEFKASTTSRIYSHVKSVHDKIKDHKCPHCEFKASVNSSVTWHIKQVHERVRDFKCFECNYAAATKSLLARHVKTCTGGKKGSSGENRIKETLKTMDIEYLYDRSIKQLDLLRFDFIIPVQECLNSETPLYIEYDGRQHFEPVCFGGCSKDKAEENLIKQQENDCKKNEYCGDALLRIKYDKFGDIPQILTEFFVKHGWGLE